MMESLLKKEKRCYLSLGSNVGEREAFINAAQERLGREPGIRIVRSSFTYESPALIYRDQPDFLNRILEIATSLPPLLLLSTVQSIERRIGRIRRFRYGPREIDIDILSYEETRLESDELILPHPGLFERDYLSVLLADLGETPSSLVEGKSALQGKPA